MVDFQKVCDYLSADVYIESLRTYRSSKKFIRSLRNAPVKEGYQEPRLLLAANECQEECFCVNLKLAKRRQDALLINEDLANQKKKLLEDEKEFQQRFIEFNALVSFDYQKRERAASNSEVSKTVIQEQKRKIDDILKLVEKLKEYEQILMEEIRKHLIYEEFMQSACYNFGPHATPHQVITRYSALESKKRYLNLRNVEITEKLTNTYQESLMLITDHHTKIVEMRGQISTNVLRYDEAIKRTNHLECLLIELWDYCAEKLKDVILSVQGIRNLKNIIHHKGVIRNPPVYDQPENMPAVFYEMIAIKNNLSAIANIISHFESRQVMMKL